MGLPQKNHVLRLGSLSKIFWYIWGINETQCNCKIKGNFFLEIRPFWHKRPRINLRKCIKKLNIIECIKILYKPGHEDAKRITI